MTDQILNDSTLGKPGVVVFALTVIVLVVHQPTEPAMLFFDLSQPYPLDAETVFSVCVFAISANLAILLPKDRHDREKRFWKYAVWTNAVAVTLILFGCSRFIGWLPYITLFAACGIGWSTPIRLLLSRSKI